MLNVIMLNVIHYAKTHKNYHDKAPLPYPTFSIMAFRTMIFSIMTFSIMTFSIMSFSIITFSIITFLSLIHI